MNATTADPITVIKDEEKKGDKKIASFIEKKQKDLENLEIKKDKELIEHKGKLSEEGREELSEAKKQGMVKYKEIIDIEEGKRETFINDSKGKTDSASSEITKIFADYIAA